MSVTDLTHLPTKLRTALKSHATSCGHIYKLASQLTVWPEPDLNGGWTLIIRCPLSVTPESLLSFFCVSSQYPVHTALFSVCAHAN